MYKIKDVEKMSVDELVGQVIMIGIPGLYLDETYKEFIKEYKIGNYILFARNYENTKQMKKFIKDLYNYAVDITGSFPLVSIDQEGGMVVRLLKDVTFPASPLTTSASMVENAPYKTGKIIASDMLKMGINLNLAPCLEINEGLSNPLVNVRVYGANKEIVLKNAKLFVKGLQEMGVLSCIKHFPGDGSSVQDSHLGLPIMNESKEELFNYNMYPFVNLLESDALMSGHCLYTSFDDVPSTLSKLLLTDLLRKDLGYQGLVISDGMEMKAIADTYGIGEGCIMALNAGCDILLLCHELSEQQEAFDFVKKAVAEGKISIDLLKEKVLRINQAKEKAKKALEKYFNESEYEVVQEEHSLMQEIVDQSFTLIKGKEPYLTSNSLIMVANARVATMAEDKLGSSNLENSLRKSFPENKIIKINSDIKLIEEINEYDNVIIYSYDACFDKEQAEVINKILTTNKEVFVVSLKGPIDQKCFSNLINYSCLYEYTPNSIKTIIKQLKKEITLNGRLPL